MSSLSLWGREANSNCSVHGIPSQRYRAGQCYLLGSGRYEQQKINLVKKDLPVVCFMNGSTCAVIERLKKSCIGPERRITERVLRPLRDSRLSSSGYQPNLHGQSQLWDLSSKVEATAYALRIAAPRRNCTARSILTGHCCVNSESYDGLVCARTNIQPLAQPKRLAF